MRAFRLATAVLALSLAAGACGGGSKVREVRSPDGGLSISIPPGAGDDITPAIRELSRSEFPPELAGATLKGALYSLEPDGARFSKPVKVTRRIEAALLGADPTSAAPLLTLMSRDSKGTWAYLEDQEVHIEGTQVVASGTTTHFSSVVAFGGSVEMTWRPDEMTLEVGGPEGEVRIFPRYTRRTDGSVRIDAPQFSIRPEDVAFGTTTRSDDNDLQIIAFWCRKPGTATWRASVRAREGVDFFDLTKRIERTVGGLTGRIVCGAKASPSPSPTKPAVLKACATVSHRALSSRFPSFIMWRFHVVNVAPGSKVNLVAQRSNGGKAVNTTVGPGGRVDVNTGIDAFGRHDLQLLTVQDSRGVHNLFPEAQRLIGPVEVTAREGVIAGAC